MIRSTRHARAFAGGQAGDKLDHLNDMVGIGADGTVHPQEPRGVHSRPAQLLHPLNILAIPKRRQPFETVGIAKARHRLTGTAALGKVICQCYSARRSDRRDNCLGRQAKRAKILQGQPVVPGLLDRLGFREIGQSSAAGSRKLPAGGAKRRRRIVRSVIIRGEVF